MPAKFGGRLSGYFDIRMKEGNANKWHGSVNVGLLSTRLNFNGPVFKNKSTLQVSLRRFNLDLIAAPVYKIIKPSVKPLYYFYDIMVKYTHQFNQKNKLTFSVFNSADKINISSKSSSNQSEKNESSYKYGWGNIASSLRLTQSVNSRLFLTHIATGSSYNYNIELKDKSDYPNYNYSSTSTLNMGLQSFNIKSGLEFIASNNLKFIAGAGYEFIKSSLGNKASSINSTYETKNEQLIGDKLQSNQTTFYAGFDYTAFDKLKINIGLHDLLFTTKKYTFNYIQPRALITYQINLNSSASLSYCKNTQALHLLTNNGVGMPTDVWVPASGNIKPQQSQQLNLNYSHFFFSKKYSLSTDIYLKTMSNLVRYKNGFDLFSTKNDWENSVHKNGKGTSYGLELMVKKLTGKLTGFVAYTLSKTTNQFEELNNGKPFFYKYDRRHELTLNLNYALNKNINLNSNFYFATGNAITLPTGVYNIPTTNPSSFTTTPFGYSVANKTNNINNFVFYYDGVNTQRTSNFSRLDLSITFEKQKKHGVRIWSFGIYNAYNHHNPFAYQYNYDNTKQSFLLKSISVFPITPFFNYEFKF